MKLLLFYLATISLTSMQISAFEPEEHQIEFGWQQEFSDKSNKVALDYFYLLPSIYINCEGASFNAYDSLDKRKNIKPRVSDDGEYLGFYRTAEISVYKRKSGGDIIAIQSGRCGSGNTCGAINSAFTFENGTWKETIEVLPKNVIDILRTPTDEVCPYIDLSKNKKGLVIMNEYTGQDINEFSWNGVQFIEK
jgi:hypothetical protein